MNAYDFLVLSAHEFEMLCRDLLQKKLGMFIESFTSGRDKGIDLRHAKLRGETTVIQVKRYKDVVTLLYNLKNEVAKVSELKPQRYILATSAGLTPDNKEHIFAMFSPFIINTEDILGREDLNNLLSNDRETELKYYKLWLASTEIMRKVLHNRIYQQSVFEMEEIVDQVKLYVQNDSFDNALRIAKSHGYVIISGDPGIGKTTLARMLILKLLSSDFDEFVYLGNSIKDGFEFFSEGKKQVFFFDDFLGKTFFEREFDVNEDALIIKFLKKIKRSNDSVLIMTTREYVLKQSMGAFEVFRTNNIQLAKCILDLSSYTKMIRAQILYNHLFFADITSEHLEDLVKTTTASGGMKKYGVLIEHPNYNPRIIETVIAQRIWDECKPENFAMKFKSYLDNPESVWLTAFDKQLNRFSQYALLVLLSMGTTTLLDDWEEAFREFLNVNGSTLNLGFDPIDFEESIRMLEDVFIRTEKDSGTKVAVNYKNPSIQDFLVHYLVTRKQIAKMILSSVVFTEQLFLIFSFNESEDTRKGRKFLLDNSLLHVFENRLPSVFLQLRSCRPIRWVYDERRNLFNWTGASSYRYQFLLRAFKEFGRKSIVAADAVHDQFQSSILLTDTSYSEHRAYNELWRVLDTSKLHFEEYKIIDDVLKKILWLNSLELFFELEQIFPDTFMEFVGDDMFKESVKRIVSQEMAAIEEHDVSSVKDHLERLEAFYDMDFEDELIELQEREDHYGKTFEPDEDDWDGRSPNLDYNDESKSMDEMFNGLSDYKG